MTDICEKQLEQRNEMSEKINEPDKIICQMNEYYNFEIIIIKSSIPQQRKLKNSSNLEFSMNF